MREALVGEAVLVEPLERPDQLEVVGAVSERAAEIGIEGRLEMSKDELIDALRNR